MAHEHTVGVVRTGPDVPAGRAGHYHEMPDGRRTSTNPEGPEHTHTAPGGRETSGPMEIREDEDARRRRKKKKKKKYSSQEEANTPQTIVPHVHIIEFGVTSPSIEVPGGHYHVHAGMPTSIDADGPEHMHRFGEFGTTGPISLESMLDSSVNTLEPE